MEPSVVRLAGEARLKSTIPLLITKLIEDGELLNEECAQSLTQIGTPAVLEAIAEAYPNAPCHFRLYATQPLEYICSDLAVEKCLHLLRQEKDQQIRLDLAHALLSQLSEEGIEETTRWAKTQHGESGTAELFGGNLHLYGGAVSRIRRVVGNREG